MFSFACCNAEKISSESRYAVIGSHLSTVADCRVDISSCLLLAEWGEIPLTVLRSGAPNDDSDDDEGAPRPSGGDGRYGRGGMGGGSAMGDEERVAAEQRERLRVERKKDRERELRMDVSRWLGTLEQGRGGRLGSDFVPANPRCGDAFGVSRCLFSITFISLALFGNNQLWSKSELKLSKILPRLVRREIIEGGFVWRTNDCLLVQPASITEVKAGKDNHHRQVY